MDAPGHAAADAPRASWPGLPTDDGCLYVLLVLGAAGESRPRIRRELKEACVTRPITALSAFLGKPRRTPPAPSMEGRHSQTCYPALSPSAVWWSARGRLPVPSRRCGHRPRCAGLGTESFTTIWPATGPGFAGCAPFGDVLKGRRWAPAATEPVSRHLINAGRGQILEIDRLDRSDRRRLGGSELLNADAPALAALAGPQTTHANARMGWWSSAGAGWRLSRGS